MRYLYILVLITSFGSLQAQSKTTEKFHKENNDAFTLFFYHNTLRMLNQRDDKDLDALIEDIEKMKFVMVEKSKLTGSVYKNLVSGYKSESFEEIMSSRFESKNFDVLLKESGGKTKGMIITVQDTDKVYILDIVGSIALNKVTKFISVLENNEELAGKIKSFTSKE